MSELENKKEDKIDRPVPHRIYYNIPLRKTIVLWKDGTKTEVTCAQDEEFSKEKGFMAAVARKIYGQFKNWNRFVNRGVEQVSNRKVKPNKKLVEETLKRR